MRSTAGRPLLAEPLYLTKYIKHMSTGIGDMIVETVAEKADESCFWLEELIAEGGLLEEGLVKPLLDEASELTAIFTAAAKTSRLSRQQSKIEYRT